jgi:hypothetical protein
MKSIKSGALGKCNSLFKFVESTFTPASTTVGVGVGVSHTNTGIGSSNMQMEELENAQWNRYILECRLKRLHEANN